MMATCTPPAQPRGFWRRRLLAPLGRLLAQGLSPAGLSRAVAMGTVCGLFPFLGATTLLALGAGLTLRLNQPAMQTVNYLLSPVQLLMIPVFVRGGAWILGAAGDGFSVASMLQAAREGSAGDFLVQFGRAGWYALVAWLIAAPVIYVVVRASVSPFINRFAATRVRGKGEA